MGKKVKAKAIDLSYIEVRQPEYIEEYDPDEDILGDFSLEELEELGAISYPKVTKVISTGGYYNNN